MTTITIQLEDINDLTTQELQQALTDPITQALEDNGIDGSDDNMKLIVNDSGEDPTDVTANPAQPSGGAPLPPKVPAQPPGAPAPITKATV